MHELGKACGDPGCAGRIDLEMNGVLMVRCLQVVISIKQQTPREVAMTDVLSPTTRDAAKQFDFLEGEWDAICRFPLPDGSWGEGRGTLKASKVLDGCVSMEFFEGPYQGTIIKGLGLRAFNPQTSEWEHTWTDTLRRVDSWSGAGDLQAAPSISTLSGRRGPGARFAPGSPGLESPTGRRTGRVTAPWMKAKPGPNTGWWISS
jgi:hypothetical protein